MKQLILASASPRRKELLEKLLHPFQIITHPTDETYDQTLQPANIVQQLALRKAKAVADDHPDAIVIGADTIVVFQNEVLGKPASEKAATDSLRKLSGNQHTVYTGVALVQGGQETVFYEKTDVLFWELTEEEIAAYVATGEPFDKAGGYGIQGLGATLVKKITGDYYSVVGLPIARLKRELDRFTK